MLIETTTIGPNHDCSRRPFFLLHRSTPPFSNDTGFQSTHTPTHSLYRSDHVDKLHTENNISEVFMGCKGFLKRQEDISGNDW